MAKITIKIKEDIDIEEELKKLIPTYQEIEDAKLEVKILEILSEVM